MQFQRWITGCLLAAAVLAVNFLLPAIAFAVVIGVGAMAAQYEVLRLLFPHREERVFLAVGFGTAAVVLAVSLSGSFPWIAFSFVAALFACFGVHLVGFRRMDAVVSDLGRQVLALVYVPVCAVFFVLLRMEPQGDVWIVLLMAVVFMGDTGAYYTGRTFGRHKLYPAVSPNKTLEGAVGGLVCSITVGLAGTVGFSLGWPWSRSILLFCLLAVAAQMGDLFESLLKRAGGVKDSGSLLPGHGGMLDRIDGLLLAGPPFYFYLKLFHYG